MGNGYRLSSRRRAKLRRLIPTICPPDVVTLDLVDAVVEGVELTLGSMPALPRNAAASGLDLPGFVPARQLRRALRDLIVVTYYDQPVVKERLGYDPDAWTAEVAPGRAERWGDEIRRHEELIVRPEPPPA